MHLDFNMIYLFKRSNCYCFWWMKYASYKIANSHKIITMLLLLKNILKSQNWWMTKLSLLSFLWTSNKFIFSTIWLRTKNMSAKNQVKWNKNEHLDTISGNLPSRWMKNNIEYFCVQLYIVIELIVIYKLYILLVIIVCLSFLNKNKFIIKKIYCFTTDS